MACRIERAQDDRVLTGSTERTVREPTQRAAMAGELCDDGDRL